MDGVWRTIAGRRVFIKEGQSLTDAMKNSGKFKTEKKDIKGTLKKQFEKEENLQKEDWKTLTSSGVYDAKQYMGEILAIKNLKIEEEYIKKVGTIPQNPQGAVTAKTKEQAQKVLKWYDNSKEASIKAQESYTKEINRFKSKKYKDLIKDKIKFYEENVKNAEDGKKWALKINEKYLK